MTYDPLKDLTPAALVAETSSTLVASTGVQARKATHSLRPWPRKPIAKPSYFWSGICDSR